MKRVVAILGTLLITTIVIMSGSAVAVWTTVDSSNNCTSIGNINGAPNDTYASIGQDGTPPVLGWVTLDVGEGNEMPADFTFWVIAETPVNETYNVSVCRDDPANTEYVGSGWDTENLTFTTPSSPQTGLWRWIHIQGTSGVEIGTGDYAYGPDIDAVGW